MSLILITISSILAALSFADNCNRDIWSLSGDPGGCHYSNGEYRLQCQNAYDCDVRLNTSFQLGNGVYSAQIKPVQGYGISTQFHLFSFNKNHTLNSIGIEFLGKHINNGKTKILTKFTTANNDFVYPAFITVNWDASQQFHTYQIHIDETNISWIFDDVIYRTLSSNTFHDFGHAEIALSNKKHSITKIRNNHYNHFINSFPVTASFQYIQLANTNTNANTSIHNHNKRRLITDAIYDHLKKKMGWNKRLVHFIMVGSASVLAMIVVYCLVRFGKKAYFDVEREYKAGSYYCEYGTALHEFPNTVAYMKIVVLIVCVSLGVYAAVMSEEHKMIWYFLIYDIIKLPVNILAFFALWGLLIIPKPADKIGDVKWNDNVLIIFRWVTRGTYPKLIHAGIEANWPILKKYKNTKMEILTETKLNIDPLVYGIPKNRFAETHTPKSFKCENETLFKARGLHNGALNSKLTRVDNCYIFHCDEESLLTDSLIRGVKSFVTNNYGRIGQGQKAYKNEEYTLGSYLCHMIDSSRAGYDASTFLVQQWVFKSAMFGFHGSYVLCPHKTEIEPDTSFDNCGMHGSIAEDAWWCMLPGNINNIGWCAGTLIEDSPFTLKDIVKQRNRWFTGLYLLIRHHPSPWRKKLLLAMSIYCWALLGPFIFITLFHLIWHGPFRIFTSYNVVLALINNISNMVWLTNFFTGQLLLIHKSYLEKTVSFFALPILLPFILLIESLGVISAILKPDRKFALVEKESQNIQGIDVEIPMNPESESDTPSEPSEPSAQIYNQEEKFLYHDDSQERLLLQDVKPRSPKPFKKYKPKKYPKKRSSIKRKESDGFRVLSISLSDEELLKQKKRKKTTKGSDIAITPRGGFGNVKTRGRGLEVFKQQFSVNSNSSSSKVDNDKPMIINVQLTLSNEQIREALKGGGDFNFEKMAMEQIQQNLREQQPIWQTKNINEWNSDELSIWINSLNNLENKIKNKVVDIVEGQAITGSDFNLMEDVIDIMDIFEIRKNPAMTILNGLKIVSKTESMNTPSIPKITPMMNIYGEESNVMIHKQNSMETNEMKLDISDISDVSDEPDTEPSVSNSQEKVQAILYRLRKSKEILSDISDVIDISEEDSSERSSKSSLEEKNDNDEEEKLLIDNQEDGEDEDEDGEDEDEDEEDEDDDDSQSQNEIEEEEEEEENKEEIKQKEQQVTVNYVTEVSSNNTTPRGRDIYSNYSTPKGDIYSNYTTPRGRDVYSNSSTPRGRDMYRDEMIYKDIMFKDKLATILKPDYNRIFGLINKAITKGNSKHKDNNNNNYKVQVFDKTGKKSLDIQVIRAIDEEEEDDMLDDDMNEIANKKVNYYNNYNDNNDILKDPYNGMFEPIKSIKVSDDMDKEEYNIPYKFIIPIVFTALCTVIWWANSANINYTQWINDNSNILIFGGNVLILLCALINIFMIIVYCRRNS